MAASVSSGPAGVGGRRAGLLGHAERWTGLTVTGLCAVAALVAGWVAARLLGGRSLYLIVYGTCAVVVAAVVAARRNRRVEAQRSTLPRRMREGQTTEVELTLSSARAVTAFVIEERLDPMLGGSVRIPVATVSSARPFVRRYTLRPVLRGVYEVGPLVAEWTDALGLARREQQLAGPDTVLVHPSTELVFDRPLTRMWEDPPLRPPISKPWPEGFEFYGMRDYVRGDDLRRIVWKAVARTGRMLVRESEQGITDRVVVLLDTDARHHSPGRPSETFELAVRVAASVGARHIADGFAVTLLANQGSLAANLRGPRARITYLDALARVETSTRPFSEAIERLLGDARRDVHTILVTPHLDRATATRVRLLIERGISTLVAAVVWEDSDPNSIHRAQEIGAQVVEVKPGASLQRAFAHSLGVGMR